MAVKCSDSTQSDPKMASLKRQWRVWGATSSVAAAMLFAHACADEGAVPAPEVGGADPSSGSGVSDGGGGAAGSGGVAGASGMVPPNGADCLAAEGPEGALKLTEVAVGLQAPLLVTHAWGDPERLYIVDQWGRITLLKNGVPSLFVDLDVNDKIETYGERGLIGVAFHPEYVGNGRFFVHYSAGPGGTFPTGDTVIAEYRRDPTDPDKADPTPVLEPLLTVPQPDVNHNGGALEFSPVDGMLYVGLGDGGGGYDTYSNGQNKNTLLGAILRLDVSASPYAIPSGNIPNGAPEIWDWGLRNPYRISFDPCTGDLYIADAGQACWEEINIEAPGQGNKNYGWKIMEGGRCTDLVNPPLLPANCALLPDAQAACLGEPTAGLTLPAFHYPHPLTACSSVVGGYVYRGSSIPWLRGAFVFADLCEGHIWMFRWVNGQVVDLRELTSELGSTGMWISSLGQGHDGEIYVVDYSNPATYSGRVLRIDPE